MPATASYRERWAARPRRARVADVALAGFILLLAVAVVVNAATDVRNSKRMKVDKRVVRHWLKARPELGRFYSPSIKVHKKVDLACAYRRPDVPHQRASQGWCLQIDARTTHTKRILLAYHCTIGSVPANHAKRRPKIPPLAPGDRYCPLKRLIKTKKA